MRIPRLHRTLILGGAALLTLGLAACGDSQPVATPDPAATIESRTGDLIYGRYCNSCHPGGGLGAGPSIKEMDLTRDRVKTIVRNGTNRMPVFPPTTITDPELELLVDYVLALRK